MWVIVRNARTGAYILNASFSGDWRNRGGGWYYVYAPAYTAFICGAPGYINATVYGGAANSTMYVNLQEYIPPPPTYT